MERSFDLDRFFHECIPITKAMGIRVVESGDQCLILTAPLELNRNDKGTAFAGTIVALATLTGAAYTLRLLAEHGSTADVVIASSEQKYLRPGTGNLFANCQVPAPAHRTRFLGALKAEGKAKWWLTVSIRSGEVEVARFKGEYVGLSPAK